MKMTEEFLGSHRKGRGTFGQITRVGVLKEEKRIPDEKLEKGESMPGILLWVP